MENIPGKIKEVVFENSKEKIKQDLEKVDFDQLRGVFEDIYKKCGLDVSRMKFVEKDSIEFFYDLFYCAANAGTDRKIEESTGKMVESSTIRFNPANYKFNIPFLKKKLLTLKLLVHEQVHITQQNDKKEIVDMGEYNVVLGQSGLSRQNYEDGDFKTVLTAFNEGLVEKIADNVLDEYLRRSGNTHLAQEGYYKTYDIGRVLIDILVNKISKFSGVPEDQVFNSLVRASYEGQSILDESLFADGGEEIKRFIEEYKDIKTESTNIPKLNEISQEEKKKLADLFSKEMDVEKYSDITGLKFLKKYADRK
jgi:DNA-binding cell septation regulator SpoVG